jgi:hypothetical protein
MIARGARTGQPVLVHPPRSWLALGAASGREQAHTGEVEPGDPDDAEGADGD